MTRNRGQGVHHHAALTHPYDRAQHSMQARLVTEPREVRRLPDVAAICQRHQRPRPIRTIQRDDSGHVAIGTEDGDPSLPKVVAYDRVTGKDEHLIETLELAGVVARSTQSPQVHTRRRECPDLVIAVVCDDKGSVGEARCIGRAEELVLWAVARLGEIDYG
ncbi:MAG: hypothetical protein ACREM1_10260 [Longimicrobiales bacterium]